MRKAIMGANVVFRDALQRVFRVRPRPLPPSEHVRRLLIYLAGYLDCDTTSMEPTHPLKTLLQLQLASDSLAVLHLPFILSSLNSEGLQPSPHTQKWSTRINSLIHSKDTGARWAGLCIAQRTSIYSKALMLECAQSWVTVVLPMLSVRMST